MTALPTNQSAADPSVALRHVAADTAQLPPAQPKPTSRTGQHEATLSVWAAGPGTSAGVWECEPGEFTAERLDMAEVCQILAGRGTVTGEDGTSADVVPGSLLVLPPGWRGTWVVHETIRKTYVLIGQ
jgi:uncharacterized protein